MDRGGFPGKPPRFRCVSQSFEQQQQRQPSIGQSGSHPSSRWHAGCWLSSRTSSKYEASVAVVVHDDVYPFFGALPAVKPGPCQRGSERLFSLSLFRLCTARAAKNTGKSRIEKWSPAQKRHIEAFLPWCRVSAPTVPVAGASPSASRALLPGASFPDRAPLLPGARGGGAIFPPSRGGGQWLCRLRLASARPRLLRA